MKPAAFAWLPVLGALAPLAPARADDIPAADARGIRIIGTQGPLLLTFLAVKFTSTPLDDRTVAEFPLAGVASAAGVQLVLGIEDLDPGAPPGTIDVYWYVGDGVVTASEFFAGTYSTSFQSDGNGVFSVDVSDAVGLALAQHAAYVGFRLSTVTADRYFLGSIAGQPEPILRVGSACYANCDGSTTAPLLTINDFVCFQTRFAAGDSYANCDGSTSPPVLNVNDFVCFIGQFAAGCP
jgi:hypothetical protein